VTDFDLRGCRSPLSYCRFQRNTWLAFILLANATLATLAPASSVSLTILSFSSIRRKTRGFRLDDHSHPCDLSSAGIYPMSRWEGRTLAGQ